ncbi:MAG: thioredoxin family protein [Rhodobacterales bacterium]|nr:thioredoxin family protein [Rhodobacterales bacterium]
MLTRIRGAFLLTGFLALVILPGALAADDSARALPTLPKLAPGEDGMHHEPWFHEGFLDLAEDLAEAGAAGKDMVVIWEQRGCPYCAKMHTVNLRIPDVVDYLKANFLIVKLDLWGAREVTDFDGEVLEERKLALKWGIRYTPTLQFFKPGQAPAGQSGKDAEVHRMFGYFYPFHFLTTFQYIREAAYESEPNFQRYVSAKGNALEAKGVHVDLMAESLPH